jgi:tRNA(Ile)-lysidine synthase
MALHVNHGLQAAASDFERHCEKTCAGWGVPLHVAHIDARPASGESPEDAARRGRYEALLAQHGDDQVETMLLALSRGAGVAGLAGMRPAWTRDGIDYVRPLLALGSAQVRDWLRAQDAGWIEDPSNASEQLTRNRIRARVLPALADAFPSYRDTFARAARHAAQAQVLLDEIAAEDLRRAGSPPAIEAVRAFSRERQANLLRHWLRAAHGQQASAAQLDELLGQVAACTTRGHDIRIKVGTGFVRRDGAVLVFTPSV